jgi:hypothetical protein
MSNEKEAKKKKYLLRGAYRQHYADYQEKRENLLDKIKKMFKRRIGEENAISSWDAFEEVFGDPDIFDIYKREFLWKLFRGLTTYLRNNTDYFIISKKDLWFIPCTKKEGEYFTDRCKKEINGLKTSIKRCREYIEKKGWKKIEGN